MDLLVSYSWHHYHQARQEIIRLLRQFGDADPQVKKTAVWGIAIVQTVLNNRLVIRHCQELFNVEPAAFQWSVKWLPVDYWCETNLDAMKDVIDNSIKEKIMANISWAMVVKKRRWQNYHTIEIVEHLTRDLGGKVNLNNPDKIIWIDIIGRKTAISLLNPEDIFSLKLSHL